MKYSLSLLGAVGSFALTVMLSENPIIVITIRKKKVRSTKKVYFSLWVSRHRFLDSSIGQKFWTTPPLRNNRWPRARSDRI